MRSRKAYALSPQDGQRFAENRSRQREKRGRGLALDKGAGNICCRPYAVSEISMQVFKERVLKRFRLRWFQREQRAPRRLVFGVAAAAFTFGSLATPAAALRVDDVTPLPVSFADARTAVTILFKEPVDFDSIDANSFRVFGRWSGPARGEFSLSEDGLSVRFKSNEAFSAGETVYVNLANTIEAADGSRLRASGYAFQFTVRAQPARMSFDIVDVMSNRTTPDARTRIYGASASDLDNDGFLDLATVNEVSGDVRVMLNRADGKGLFGDFLEPEDIGREGSPNEPADFDNDGNVDLCVAAGVTDQVWILMGKGDGTFEPAIGYDVGNDPHGIAVLDVDGDADWDIVNSNARDNNMSVLINDGNGVFGEPSFFDSGFEDDFGLGVGDMDENGVVDVIAGHRGGEKVVVYLNDGDGTFSVSDSVDAGGPVWQITTGDVDGDRHLDVTSSNSFAATASVYRGDGHGNIGAAETIPGDALTSATDLGDLDGDGDLDWVLSTFNGGRWLVYENDGDGTFTFHQDFLAPSNPSCAVLFDVDNDGDLDMGLTDEISDEVLMAVNVTPPVCSPEPRDCTAPSDGPAAKRLKIRADPPPSRRVRWVWKGPGGSKAEFADPKTTHDFALCVYRADDLIWSGTAGYARTCAGRPCWRENGKSYIYRDRVGVPDGISLIRLRARESSEISRITFNAKGEFLELPAIDRRSDTLVVQMQKSGDERCWGSVFAPSN